MANLRFLFLAVLLPALLLLGGGIRGDEAVVNDAPRPRIAVPTAETEPLVTASPNDPAWNRAAVIPLDTISLGEKPPAAGSIPKTEVRLLWNRSWLFVRFLCHDDHAYLPAHGRGAPIYLGDTVEIFIDPVGDYREWKEMDFNAANDVFDQTTVCTREPKWDRSLRIFNEVTLKDIWTIPNDDPHDLRSAAQPWQVDGRAIGWIVDVAISAPQLLKRTGQHEFQPMTLRGDFLRYKWISTGSGTHRDLLSLTWSPILLGAPQRSPAAFGLIELSPVAK